MILLFTGSAGFKSSRFALHAASWLWIGSLFMLVPQMMHALLRVKMLCVLRVPLHFFTWLANHNGCSVSWDTLSCPIPSPLGLQHPQLGS